MSVIVSGAWEPVWGAHAHSLDDAIAGNCFPGASCASCPPTDPASRSTVSEVDLVTRTITITTMDHDWSGAGKAQG